MSFCTFSCVSEQTTEEVFNGPAAADCELSELVKLSRINLKDPDHRPFCFRPHDRVFSPAAMSDKPLLIGGERYLTVNEYMWRMIIHDLTNTPLPYDWKKQGLPHIFKGHFIGRKKVEQWVLNRGLLYLQKAILRRIQTDIVFHKMLLGTRNRLIVATNSRDSFFCVDTSRAKVHDWFNKQCRKTVTVNLPKFPIRKEHLHHLPEVEGGRNVLGSIYMALREQLKHRDPRRIKIRIYPLNHVEMPHSCQVAASRKRRYEQEHPETFGIKKRRTNINVINQLLVRDFPVRQNGESKKHDNKSVNPLAVEVDVNIVNSTLHGNGVENNDRNGRPRVRKVVTFELNDEPETQVDQPEVTTVESQIPTSEETTVPPNQEPSISTEVPLPDIQQSSTSQEGPLLGRRRFGAVRQTEQERATNAENLASINDMMMELTGGNKEKSVEVKKEIKLEPFTWPPNIPVPDPTDTPFYISSDSDGADLSSDSDHDSDIICLDDINIKIENTQLDEDYDTDSDSDDSSVICLDDLEDPNSNIQPSSNTTLGSVVANFSNAQLDGPPHSNSTLDGVSVKLESTQLDENYNADSEDCSDTDSVICLDD